jgi:hypothetical protein
LISYVGKRLLSVIPVLVVVAVTVSSIIDITPGDPASIMFGPDATPAQVAQLRHTMVFDRPLWTQLVDWIGGVVRGDLGYSVFLHRNVSTAIGSHLQPTLYLVIFAELLAVAIAVPRSRRCAARRHRDPSEYTRLHARDRGRPDVPRVSARHRHKGLRDHAGSCRQAMERRRVVCRYEPGSGRARRRSWRSSIVHRAPATLTSSLIGVVSGAAQRVGQVGGLRCSGGDADP